MELTKELAVEVFDNKNTNFKLLSKDVIQSIPGCDLVQRIYFNESLNKHFSILSENPWSSVDSDSSCIVCMKEVEKIEVITYKYVVKE